MSAGAPASARPLSRTAAPVLGGVHRYLTATGASSISYSYIGRTLRAVGPFGPLDVMGMAGPLAALSAQPLPGAAAGALPVPVAFAGTALPVRAPEVRQLLVAVKGKLAHAR
ncbi:hypothetical protein ACTPOK_27655 [Streptomyces inhibens]|uniref:hypothetical protein n=1 Tax=Streptomyces inhibens TaxID=2293571 RepID=UPI00402B049F